MGITEQTRDFITIKGKQVRHDTAARDYVCSTCGGGLITRCIDGQWLTMCCRDNTHDPDTFIKQATWQAIQTRRMIEAEKAREVFANLPADVQAAIRA
jgi:predicted RNA-binding Zn-ribbon protein involved in translation (DUF1610 family)